MERDHGFAICMDVTRYMESLLVILGFSDFVGRSGVYQVCRDIASIFSESAAGLGFNGN